MSRVVTVVLIVAVACVCAAPEHNKVKRAAYFGLQPGRVQYWGQEPDNHSTTLGASRSTTERVEHHRFNNTVQGSNYGVLGINRGTVGNTHNSYVPMG